MALPVSFRWDEEFVARIDEARGDVPRSRFVRRAVERVLLADFEARADGLVPVRTVSEEEVREMYPPAEQPEELPEGHPARAEQPRRVYVGPQAEAEFREQLGRRHAPNCKCPVCS